jgi:hypothetical protein
MSALQRRRTARAGVATMGERAAVPRRLLLRSQHRRRMHLGRRRHLPRPAPPHRWLHGRWQRRFAAMLVWTVWLVSPCGSLDLSRSVYLSRSARLFQPLSSVCPYVFYQVRLVARLWLERLVVTRARSGSSSLLRFVALTLSCVVSVRAWLDLVGVGGMGWVRSTRLGAAATVKTAVRHRGGAAKPAGCLLAHVPLARCAASTRMTS